MRQVASGLSPRIKEHNLTLVAAGVAFYAFLAFVPALVAFISIYGLFADPDDVADQVADVASALPEEVQDFLTFQLTSIASTNRASVSFTLVIAIALALWSASGGMAALITGIHVAHEHDEPSGFVAKRGKALGLDARRDGVSRDRHLRDRRGAAVALESGAGQRGRDHLQCTPLAPARRGDDRGSRAAVQALLEGEPARLARDRHAGCGRRDSRLARRLGAVSRSTPQTSRATARPMGRSRRSSWCCCGCG